MSTYPMRMRFGALVLTGMVLLFAGVVAGSVTGNILRGMPQNPLLLGEENAIQNSATSLQTGTTSGSALGVRQVGTGTGLRADSDRGNAAIFVAHDADRSGVIAQNEGSSPGSGAALTAQGNRNTAIRATSEEGFGLWVAGSAGAIYADGDASIAGDLTLTGTCTGCSTAVLAVNDSDVTLRKGDSVTITGVTQGADLALLTIAPASRGDLVIGIVDTAVDREVRQVEGETATAVYIEGDDEVEPAGTLRLIMEGLVESVRADASAGQTVAGDSLVAGDIPGSLALSASGPSSGLAVGYALGPIENGRVSVLIAPH